MKYDFKTAIDRSNVGSAKWEQMKGMNPHELERFLHRDAELFLNEGHAFGEEGSGFERMNLACPTQTMMDGLGRLAGAIRRRGSTGA